MNVGISKTYVTINPIFNSVSAFVPAQADSFTTLPLFTSVKEKSLIFGQKQMYQNVKET